MGGSFMAANDCQQQQQSHHTDPSARFDVCSAKSASEVPHLIQQQQQQLSSSSEAAQSYPSPYASVQVVNGGCGSEAEVQLNGKLHLVDATGSLLRTLKSMTLIRGERTSKSGISSSSCGSGCSSYATVKRSPQTRIPVSAAAVVAGADRNVYDFPSGE